MWAVGLIAVIAMASFTCKEEPVGTDNHTKADTTSHDYKWQMFSLAGASTSYLNDVAIINDTCIWAVGQMYLKDSAGNTDPTIFNVAKWNGQQWSIERILYPTQSGQYPLELNSIFVFTENDIWVSAGSQPMHWNGKQWEIFNILSPVFYGAIFKIWGTSSKNLYIVGANGSIAHYDGKIWTKIESGTTLAFYDIYGGYNSQTKEWEVIAVATDMFMATGTEIVKLIGNTAVKESHLGILYDIIGVWFYPGKKYYVVGSGIYQKGNLSDSVWSSTSVVTMNYTNSIRGNSINDIFFATPFDELLHYNGSTWKSYKIGFGNSGGYTNVAVKGDIVAAVGALTYDIRWKALAVIGKRK
jgi:hypothetical protein